MYPVLLPKIEPPSAEPYDEGGEAMSFWHRAFLDVGAVAGT